MFTTFQYSDSKPYTTKLYRVELEPRSGDAGADAADTGLMERAEWAEPGSMTDSY